MTRKKRGSNRWRVGGCAAIDLIAAQHHKVGLLLVQHLVDEIEGSWIRLAFPAGVHVGYRISTLAHAVAQMQVSNLQNLEPSVVRDARLGLLGLGDASPVDREVNAEKSASRVEQQGRPHYGPARSRIDGVVAKEHVDICDNVLGVARLLLLGPFDPQAAGPRFPSSNIVGLVLDTGVQAADSHVHDNAVVGRQVLLMLAIDVEVGARGPSPAEVELLVDAMPHGWVEVAGGKEVDAGAGNEGDVGDDEAGMVGGHVAVDGIGQDSVVAVEEQDDEQGEGQGGAELRKSANLMESASISAWVGHGRAGKGRGMRLKRETAVTRETRGKAGAHDSSRHLGRSAGHEGRAVAG